MCGTDKLNAHVSKNWRCANVSNYVIRKSNALKAKWIYYKFKGAVIYPKIIKNKFLTLIIILPFSYELDCIYFDQCISINFEISMAKYVVIFILILFDIHTDITFPLSLLPCHHLPIHNQKIIFKTIIYTKS